MVVLTMAKTSLEVINANLQNLIASFEEFKGDQKEFMTSVNTKINVVENAGTETKTRINNFAIFQTVFSLLIGAIASYLGVKGK